MRPDPAPTDLDGTTGTNLPLSQGRLRDSLMELARIGALPNGGNDRQTLTDGDGQARALLRR